MYLHSGTVNKLHQLFPLSGTICSCCSVPGILHVSPSASHKDLEDSSKSLLIPSQATFASHVTFVIWRSLILTQRSDSKGNSKRVSLTPSKSFRAQQGRTRQRPGTETETDTWVIHWTAECCSYFRLVIIQNGSRKQL